MADKQTLVHAMAAFQDKSPDEIAAVVKRRGIKGRMGTTYGCPMALLLGGVSTGEFVIGRRYIVRRSGDKIEKMRTPRQIEQFMRKFDIGGYPELIAPPPRCLKPTTRRPNKGSGSGRTRPPIKNHLAKLVNRFGKQD